MYRPAGTRRLSWLYDRKTHGHTRDNTQSDRARDNNFFCRYDRLKRHAIIVK